MDGGLEGKWLKDSGCSRHMTGNKKWFPSLTHLSHKEYVTFEDDKKGKVFGTGIKVNDYFTLNDVALVDKFKYNLRSEGGKWEPIKILHENSTYVPNLTQQVSFLTRSRPHSNRQAIDPRNWVRKPKPERKHKAVQANPPTSHEDRLVVDWVK
jgi:hypothetical protein